MILRAVKVSNWRRLRDISVSEFSPRITVITGPNRTGKTSLMEAIRRSLVDWHYDTTQSKDVVPWNSTAVPEVSIEFEASGVSYLMTKRYTKKKGGGAELYRLNGGGGKRLLAEGKEVTASTQQLIDLDSSKAGLAQLLWVDQGVVAVPAINDDIGNNLRRVLGSVITGQDEKFHQTLWDEMKASFTSEANALEGKPRAVSSLVKAQGRLAETERGVKQIHAEFAKSEDLLGDFDRLQGDRAKAEAEVHRRKETLDKLEAAQKELDDKRGQFEQWQLRATGIQRTVTQLEADANKYSQYEDEIRQANAALKAKQATLEPLEAAIEQATKARQDGAEQRRKLDEDQPKHGLRAKVVRTMRLLFDIRRRAEELNAKLTSCRELVESTEEAERQLGQTPTPSSKDISCIQSAIQRLGEVDAELNAAQLVISIDAKMPLAVTSIVDGSPEEKSNVTTEEPRAWQVRQHANIVLSDVATFNVRRGAENVELEKLVAERKALDAGLQVQLQQWDIPTTDRQSIVPSLTTLTTARAELQARATGLRDQLKRVAPKGVGSLETESAFLSSERNRLLKDCPEVMDWDPTESAVIEVENQLQAEESSLQSRVRDVSALERDAAAGFASAQQQLQIVQTKLAELKTALAADQARLGELTQTYGSQEKLGATLTLSRDELASAQAELEKHRLTEEQERVASDLADAKAALDESQKRHADVRERIAETQGELRNVEGLHARRVALEQALGVAQRDLDRTTVDLEARRLLLQLFAQARDESVEKAIAPVSELVGTWLTRLYGADHLRVNFTTDLKVKDVTVPEGNSLIVPEATSYGEREQLGILVRLAYGAALAQDEKQVVIIDDPLAHSDDELHERMLAILGEAADKNLQILILTCHADRFRKLAGAVMVDLPGSPGT